jgi:hypothetical protein
MREPIKARFPRRLAAFSALCVIAGATAAFAYPHHGGWHRRGHWHAGWGYAGGYYAAPPIVYGSPYYAPPPVVYTPGFGINIHIR